MSLRQGDPLWAQQKLGSSRVSIGSSGCLLTVYAEIQRIFGDADATPATTNKIAQQANAFEGAGIIQSRLAAALHLQLGSLVVDEATIRQELVRPRDRDTFFVVHVDHGKSKAPDHFILGLLVNVAAGRILCADPATGGAVKLSLSTLSGPANWGNKTYVIRSVRCVTKRQSTL